MVHIRRKLDSDTLYLPELKPLIGKMVEIVVKEEGVPESAPSTGDWDAAIKAVQDLEDYDFDAVRRQREFDLKHAQDHLP